jgi:hypothetical protein
MDNIDHPTDKKKFWRASWQLLRRAAEGEYPPFRNAFLATSGPDQEARNRTVVLRKVEPDTHELYCYTDRRSNKFASLEAGRTDFNWLFWSAEDSLQFSGGGPTRRAEPAVEDELFATVPDHSLVAYVSIHPPGHPLREAGSDLPDGFEGAGTQVRRKLARENFAVLITTVRRADLLHLSRTGNRRMQGRWRDGRWSLTWVTP